MSLRVCALLVCVIAAGCGGSSTAPLAPSPSSATIGNSASTAAISGSVQTPAGSAAGMTVEVVGSTLRSTIGSDNRFMFSAVPAGQHRLRFSGAGANAEVGLEPVASGETINVIVNVDGAIASVQTGHKLAVDETRFDGRIESIDSDLGTLVVATRTVTTSGTTTVKNGSQTIALASLAAGTLVEITGVQGETTFAARLIDVLPDPRLQLNGAVAVLTGSASSFEFTLGTRRVLGGSATEFKGGSNPSFARLGNGVDVHVTALDKGTHVEASRIILHEDPSATPASATGTLTDVTGSSPELTLIVGTSTVVTNAATQVRQGNQAVTLAALAVDQTLAVEGTLELDGTILAARIQIEGGPASPPHAVAFDEEGVVSGLGGTCPAATFTLLGKTIAATAGTHFVQLTCATLANGETVRVKGTLQTDGSVIATMIQSKKTK